eukprot:COSAG06_NODE_45742_length_352_cov_0.988142_1_plen_37_part_01
MVDVRQADLARVLTALPRKVVARADPAVDRRLEDDRH